MNTMGARHVCLFLLTLVLWGEGCSSDFCTVREVGSDSGVSGIPLCDNSIVFIGSKAYVLEKASGHGGVTEESLRATIVEDLCWQDTPIDVAVEQCRFYHRNQPCPLYICLKMSEADYKKLPRLNYFTGKKMSLFDVLVEMATQAHLRMSVENGCVYFERDGR